MGLFPGGETGFLLQAAGSAVRTAKLQASALRESRRLLAGLEDVRRNLACQELPELEAFVQILAWLQRYRPF